MTVDGSVGLWACESPRIVSFGAKWVDDLRRLGAVVLGSPSLRSNGNVMWPTSIGHGDAWVRISMGKYFPRYLGSPSHGSHKRS